MAHRTQENSLFTVTSLDKGYIQLKKSQIEEVQRIRYRVRHGTPMPSLGTPPSEDLNAVSNLEILRALRFRGFYEGFIT